MIVVEPPYDLVCLFADAEAQKFCEELIERGQHSGRECMRPIRWRSLRDPRRDPVWREPETVLAPFLRGECRFLVIWDHQGSGREAASPHELESDVLNRLRNAGVPEGQSLALSLAPELEALFVPVWSRVKQVLAKERAQEPPEDPLVLAALKSAGRPPATFEQAMNRHPKEMFEALIRVVRLRRAPHLYGRIGEEISLPQLKKHEAALRIAERLATWFPYRVPEPR